MQIAFITLRRRSPKLLQEVYGLPRSAWRTVELNVPTRQYRHPRVFDQQVCLAGGTFRQFFVLDLGHEEPTILLSLSNAAVDRARRNKPKTKFNTKKFQQRFRSARGGRERLQALIFSKNPALPGLAE